MIPFNRASLVGRELEYVREAIEGGHISGDGPFTRRCHELLERELGVEKALLTTSGTHALEMCTLLLDLGPGDEVIVPSFTFVSSVTALCLRGAQPVLADVRRDTQNLDEEQVAALITPRTRAILPTHYAGVGCELDALAALCDRHGLSLVEDNAHGLFGRYKGRPLGSFGRLAALSFHETKNFTCGEGGALLINDPALVTRAEILREKGTDRSRFFRGEVDKYTWVDLGSSYLPSEILAAFLFGQLERREVIQQARQRLWERYRERLGDWAGARGIQLPSPPAHCEHPYHMFHLLLPSREERDHLIQELRALDIKAVFHYLPLHLSPMGRKLGHAPGDLPVTEEVSDRLLRLPFYIELVGDDQERVCDALVAALPA